MFTVTGLFDDKESAERAYQYALDTGYSSSDIDVIMSKETCERHYGEHTTLKIEVCNKTFQGVLVSGVVGATVGALIEWAIPGNTLKEYEIGLKSGGIVIGVKSKSDKDRERFDNDWKTHKGLHVHSQH